MREKYQRKLIQHSFETKYLSLLYCTGMVAIVFVERPQRVEFYDLDPLINGNTQLNGILESQESCPPSKEPSPIKDEDLNLNLGQTPFSNIHNISKE